MTLRLTDFPLVIHSHSDIEKPLGAVLMTVTHLLTARVLSPMSKRIWRDSSKLVFPDCYA